jgi:hypothetical protein
MDRIKENLKKMVSDYIRINRCFRKKLVYNLGSEAGFFSEFNNMILAMLYCLKYQIKFELYSYGANFGFEKGWLDYFLPFCDESDDTRNSKLNIRQPEQSLSFRKKVKVFYFKLITGTDYLTYELWNNFHNKSFKDEFFNIPELNIHGFANEACRQLIHLTWRYNRETKEQIDGIISKLNLPDNYLGFHIRGGDKHIEYEKIDISRYIEIAEKHSSLRYAFVLSDDYRIIMELKNNYPDWIFFSLCDVNERGYYHSSFSNSDPVDKKLNMIKLFASIDILSKSQHFIGTFSSNPGMYLGMRMRKENIHGVDMDEWTIW